MSQPHFIPIWIAAGRKDDPITFGSPCTTPTAAFAVLKELVRSGEASMGVVVKVDGDEREVIETGRLNLAEWEGWKVTP
jgi:hypothetical protein